MAGRDHGALQFFAHREISLRQGYGPTGDDRQKRAILRKEKWTGLLPKAGWTVFVCRALPANEKFEHLSALCVSVVNFFLQVI
jgi:hypothetical protein